MTEISGHGISYLLPLKCAAPIATQELTQYLQWLARIAGEVIVIDASPDNVFGAHAASWGTIVTHVRPAADLATPMGKVGNVLTGLRLARFELVIVADDDVRYDARSLSQVRFALEDADVVRPQNYFDPLPWHARWDTGRMLLNRVTGGDWPGTIAVRRSFLTATGGYDGRALFENLELVRTVIAAGGKERALLDAYVMRRPSTTRHFWSQRIRQAYDEMARPARLLIQLAILPTVLALVLTGNWTALGVVGAFIVTLAEIGRRRAGAAAVFPVSTSLFSLAWTAERAVCSWLALFAKVFLGGVPYRGSVLSHAATPLRELRARHGAAKINEITPSDRTPRYQSV